MDEGLLAVFVVMLVDGYFRPGELLGLKRGCVLPPTHSGGAWAILLFPQEEAERSKTNQSDDTVLMDGGRCPWMKPVYSVLAQGPRGEKVFPWKYARLARVFGLAARRIGVPLVPYQGRHSGASIDAARRHRPLLEIQKRGRWASLKSVTRYEKSGKLSETWRSLTPIQRRHFEVCEGAIERAVLHRRGLPPPLDPRHLT